MHYIAVLCKLLKSITRCSAVCPKSCCQLYMPPKAVQISDRHIALHCFALLYIALHCFTLLYKKRRAKYNVEQSTGVWGLQAAIRNVIRGRIYCNATNVSGLQLARNLNFCSRTTSHLLFSSCISCIHQDCEKIKLFVFIQ